MLDKSRGLVDVEIEQKALKMSLDLAAEYTEYHMLFQEAIQRQFCALSNLQMYQKSVRQKKLEPLYLRNAELHYQHSSMRFHQLGYNKPAAESHHGLCSIYYEALKRRLLLQNHVLLTHLETAEQRYGIIRMSWV